MKPYRFTPVIKFTFEVKFVNALNFFIENIQIVETSGDETETLASSDDPAPFNRDAFRDHLAKKAHEQAQII